MGKLELSRTSVGVKRRSHFGAHVTVGTGPVGRVLLRLREQCHGFMCLYSVTCEADHW